MPFSESNIPDLQGKVVIVTGGNSGIGKQLVKVLVSKGAKVYLAARSEEKFKQAVEDISDNSGEIKFLKLDLTTAKGAKEAAEEFKSKESSLHILFNNAGIMGTQNGVLTEDGYELRWAVNAFGPFVFTYHLLPLLQQTAEASPLGTVRIVNVASDAPKRLSKNDGIPLDDPTVGQKASTKQCYGYSKMGNIIITRQLAKRYPKIWSFAPHPGTIQTELIAKLGVPRIISWLLDGILIKSVDYGALTPLYAGTSQDIHETKNGKFLMPVATFEDRLPHPQAGDDEFGVKLWEWNMAAMKKAGVD
ncbi:short-chain alcohol dehydrogenase [Marasmius crinis-equi]|uniref:Short-chain alcohol dehydrogenase n=1 Tax=Marasmius crinis-equi TaxID=585013 RepID=A0ABR3FJT8_9AGAR